MIDWFERYENGLEQDVGERGANVSAGERQFIALLRAVLAKRQIIVFDEATANLDIESESSILDATDTLLDYQTSVVIAHRLETILNAEKILVMSEGKLQQLSAPNELYKNPQNIFVSDFIGETNFLKASTKAQDGEFINVSIENLGEFKI